jgi:hypothetical protein
MYAIYHTHPPSPSHTRSIRFLWENPFLFSQMAKTEQFKSTSHRFWNFSTGNKLFIPTNRVYILSCVGVHVVLKCRCADAVLMRSCVGDALGAGVERWFVDVLHVDDC